MRWSIEELIKYWGYYRERNIWSWFRYFFHNRKRRFKLFWNWVFTGYCKESMWNLDEYFSQVILFRLKKFRGEKKFGHPTEMESIEEWDQTLDTLIEKFEILIDRKIEERAVHFEPITKKIEFNGKMVDSWTSGGTEEQKEEIMKFYLEQAKNDEEAITLFAKIYFDLWD
jgi:hypothetical protein